MIIRPVRAVPRVMRAWGLCVEKRYLLPSGHHIPKCLVLKGHCLLTMSIWQDCRDSVNLSSTHHLQVVLAIAWSQTIYLMCSGSRAGFQGRLMCPWAVLTTKGRLCLRHVCYLCIWIATTTHPTLIIDDTMMHTALLWPLSFDTDTATLEATKLYR